MELDNDLMNRWLGAAFMTEQETRDLIEELQQARNDLAECETKTEATITELTEERDSLAGDIETLRETIKAVRTALESTT